MYIKWDFFIYKFWFCVFFLITKMKIVSAFLNIFISSPYLYIKDLFFFIFILTYSEISWLISNMKCHPVAPSQTPYISHLFLWSQLLLALFQTHENKHCCYRMIHVLNTLTHLSQKGHFVLLLQEKSTIQGCIISFNSSE